MFVTQSAATARGIPKFFVEKTQTHTTGHTVRINPKCVSLNVNAAFAASSYYEETPTGVPIGGYRGVQGIPM